MTSTCSSVCEYESDELKRSYRAALKSNSELKATIQSLQNDLGDRYLKDTLLKDSVDGLYRQSNELLTHLRQQHPAVKGNDVAQIFSNKLVNFQVDCVRFCKGKVISVQSSDTKEAEKKIESLKDEIHALKSEMVQTTMQENHQVEELKQLSEDLKGEVQRKERRINILAEKLKSSKDDNQSNEIHALKSEMVQMTMQGNQQVDEFKKQMEELKCEVQCKERRINILNRLMTSKDVYKSNEFKVLTGQVNRLLEDIELLKVCQEKDQTQIAELEAQLIESKLEVTSKDDEITSKDDEITIMKLEMYKLKQQFSPSGFRSAPATSLIPPRPLGEKLDRAKSMSTPTPPPIPPRSAYKYQPL